MLVDKNGQRIPTTLPPSPPSDCTDPGLDYPTEGLDVKGIILLLVIGSIGLIALIIGVLR